MLLPALIIIEILFFVVGRLKEAEPDTTNLLVVARPIAKSFILSFLVPIAIPVLWLSALAPVLVTMAHPKTSSEVESLVAIPYYLGVSSAILNVMPDPTPSASAFLAPEKATLLARTPVGTATLGAIALLPLEYVVMKEEKSSVDSIR